MKKILWVSEFNFNTGFSRVSEALIGSLSSSYDITVLDVHRCHPNIPYGDLMLVGTKTPGWKDETGKVHGDYLGVERFAEIYDQFDTIFILHDVFDIAKYLKAIKKEGKRLPEIVVYFPVDLNGHNKEWYKDFGIVRHAVTYTEFGLREVTPLLPMNFAGKLSMVPHGIDTDLFYPMNGDMNKIRMEFMKGETRLNDCFVLLNANRNQPRKRLDITVEAFSIFAKNIPEARLWMHCGFIDSSMNIYRLASRYKVEKKLIISSDKPGILRFSNKQLNHLYNICDVGLNSSIGEGFGLTSIEHASTGKPQIVPSHSALYELFSGLTPIATASVPFMLDNLTQGLITDPQSMADCMTRLYEDKKYYAACSQNCREKFTSGKYQWKNIAHTWTKYL